MLYCVACLVFYVGLVLHCKLCYLCWVLCVVLLTVVCKVYVVGFLKAVCIIFVIFFRVMCFCFVWCSVLLCVMLFYFF